MNYTKLRYDEFFKENPAAARRTIDRLQALKTWLNTPKADGGAGIPRKVAEGSLLLCTWNLRDFGKDKGFGPRTLEPIYYMAEIISGFDLVALQEITSDMRLFHNLMHILGRDWDYIATDVTGNQERMVFVFDRRKVDFKSIVGEITLPENQLIRSSQELELPTGTKITNPDGGVIDLPKGTTLELPKKHAKLLAGKQFARTPFLVSFQAGWFKFNLCTVHMYFGEGTAGVKRRTQEIAELAKFFKKRASKERKAARERGQDDDDLASYILLGDFNILAPEPDTGESETLNALLKNGFFMHDQLKNTPTNMFETEHYDQIAVLKNHGRINIKDTDAGVLSIYDMVYRANEGDVAVRRKEKGVDFPTTDTSDFDAYFETMAASAMRDVHDAKRHFTDNVRVAKGDPRTQAQIREWYTTKWRTYQLSDHLPLWMELKIDFSKQYFDEIESDMNEGS